MSAHLEPFEQQAKQRSRRRATLLAVLAAGLLFAVVFRVANLVADAERRAARAEAELNKLKASKAADHYALAERDALVEKTQRDCEFSKRFGLHPQLQLSRANRRWMLSVWFDSPDSELTSVTYSIDRLYEGKHGTPVPTTEGPEFCAGFDVTDLMTHMAYQELVARVHSVFDADYEIHRTLKELGHEYLEIGSAARHRYIAITNALREQGVDAQVFERAAQTGDSAPLALALGPFDTQGLSNARALWQARAPSLRAAGFDVRQDVLVTQGTEYANLLHPLSRCNPP